MSVQLILHIWLQARAASPHGWLLKATKPQSSHHVSPAIPLYSFQPYISDLNACLSFHPVALLQCRVITRGSFGHSTKTTCHRFATANHPCTSPLLCKKRIHHYPLSNTHNHHPLARRRPSTTQQPQTHRRFNHPGSSTFFQQQLPQLLTTSHKAPNPRHHRPNARQLTCYAIRRLTLLPQVQSLSRC